MRIMLCVIAILVTVVGVLGWRSCSQASTIDTLETAHAVDAKSVKDCGATLAINRQDLDACNTQVDQVAAGSKLADVAADQRAHAALAPPKAPPRVVTVQEMNQWFASIQSRLH